MPNSSQGSLVASVPRKPDTSGIDSSHKVDRKIPFAPLFRKLFGGKPLEVIQRRKWITATCILGFLGTNFLMFLRFFFPRVLYEPNTVFKIGYPSDFGFGVHTKFQKDYRIWVVHDPGKIFVIYARCTHLGCTPDWKPSENKFKCPCHGSGYDNDGINFEGPAPRPMDRAKIELNPEGQIVVDTSVLYQWPKGEKSHFNDPGAYIPA